MYKRYTAVLYWIAEGQWPPGTEKMPVGGGIMKRNIKRNMILRTLSGFLGVWLAFSGLISWILIRNINERTEGELDQTLVNTISLKAGTWSIWKSFWIIPVFGIRESWQALRSGM